MTNGTRVRMPGPPCIIPTPRDGTVIGVMGGAVIVALDDGFRGRYQREELTVIPRRYHGARGDRA